MTTLIEINDRRLDRLYNLYENINGKRNPEMRSQRQIRHGSGRPFVAPDAVNRRLIECRRGFLRYFRRRLGRPEDAEDAFQDFCLKVIRAERMPDDSQMIDAWLGRILRNTLVDHYRRCASRQRGEAAYERELQVAPHATEADHGERACPCIHEALPRLKPEYAEILRRAFFDEVPRARIADELGLTANNVGVRLLRARRALRHKLEENCTSCRADGFLKCDYALDHASPGRTTPSSAGCDVTAE